MRHTCARILAGVALAGLLSSPANPALITLAHADSSGRERDGRVDRQGPPRLAKYLGLTAGDWAAAWWQAVLATAVEPGNHHPLIDGGAFGETNRTMFVGGPVLPGGSPRVTIPVTVSPGTHLVVAIITVECSVAEPAPFHGEDEAELRTCANGLLDLVVDPSASIDGSRVNDLRAHRVESPLFRYGPLTEGNVLGLPAGTQSDAVAAGYFLVLPPFSAGVHRIDLRATVPAFDLAVDAAIIVNVEPKRGK